MKSVDGIFKYFTKPLQNCWSGYIFLIFKLDIIHELKIYKSMKILEAWQKMDAKWM
jgi:hypothetical protein